MTSILLKKCTKDELEVLREQINAFIQQRDERPISKSKGNVDFYVSCILMDILKRLSIKIRNKIELSCKYQVTIRIPIFEASALLLVCHWELSFLNAYQKNVLMKIRNSIDQQLTNLN
jgi:hypothetical protein